jgi:hypothetical protein
LFLTKYRKDMFMKKFLNCITNMTDRDFLWFFAGCILTGLAIRIFS